MSVATVEKHRARAAEREDPRWTEALEEHRAALAAFLDTADELSEDAWREPWAPRKWTRAQIAEHLALAYEAAIRELTTGETLRVRVTGVRQTLLRWIFLPHILFHRTLPVRVSASRQTQPGDAAVARAQMLRRLRELGERYEREMERARAQGRGTLTHPYFGCLDPVRAMRFVAVHIEHHTRQVART